MFEWALRNGSRSQSILEFVDSFAGKDEDVSKEEGEFSIISDIEETTRSVREVERLDANEYVFTVLSYDWSLKCVTDE